MEKLRPLYRLSVLMHNTMRDWLSVIDLFRYKSKVIIIHHYNSTATTVNPVQPKVKSCVQKPVTRDSRALYTFDKGMRCK